MINLDKPAIFSVGCERDKKLKEEWNPMEYEHGIQAGAALSEKIIYEYRDDVGEDNISNQNKRYCEFSAIYWIWKNIKAPYIGICHYRRKFQLTKNEMDSLLDNNVEIISTIPRVYDLSTKELFCGGHFRSDWNLFMTILSEKTPDVYEKAIEIFDRNDMHIASMGIFKYEYFDELCSWMFPIHDEFCKRSSEKYSTYQHRDVAFIGERMVSLFYELKKDKCITYETNFCFLETEDAGEIDFDGEEYIDTKIYKRFENHQIDECYNDCIRIGLKTPLMSRVGALLTIYRDEMRNLPETFFEYSDEFEPENLDKQLEKLDRIGNLIYHYVKETEDKHELEDFLFGVLKNRIYSYVYIKDVMDMIGVLSNETMKLLLKAMERVYER